MRARKDWLLGLVGLVFLVSGVMLIFMDWHNAGDITYVGRLMAATGLLLIWFVGIWVFVLWIKKVRKESGYRRH